MDADALWEYAVKALAARAHSTGELRLKLSRKAAAEADVAAVLSRLQEYGYLNDARYAENFASTRLQDRGFGARRVLRDLRERRVAPSLAQRTVEKVYAGTDEDRLVEDHLRRRLRTAKLADPKDLAAAYRKLARAGFSPGAIVRALKKFARNPELLDGFEPPEETEGESG